MIESKNKRCVKIYQISCKILIHIWISDTLDSLLKNYNSIVFRALVYGLKVLDWKSSNKNKFSKQNDPKIIISELTNIYSTKFPLSIRFIVFIAILIKIFKNKRDD